MRVIDPTKSLTDVVLFYAAANVEDLFLKTYFHVWS